MVRADKLVAQWEEARSEFFGPDVRAIVCDFAEWHLGTQSDTITRLQAALENPTPEMIDAGRAALREHTDEEIDVAEIYRAMTQALGGE